MIRDDLKLNIKLFKNPNIYFNGCFYIKCKKINEIADIVSTELAYTNL